MPRTASLKSPVAEPPAGKIDQKSNANKNSGAVRGKQEKADESDALYLRVLESDDKKPLALQTAIVRYRGKAGSQYAGKIVDLVGVVHIGQRDYYSDLNDRLGRYDSVLYELVAPDGTRIKPGGLATATIDIGFHANRHERYVESRIPA